MKDFKENELKVGDKVVFIYKSRTGGARLMEGEIEEFKNGNAVIKDCHYSFYNYDPKNQESISLRYDDRIKVKSTSIYKV